MQAHSSYVFDIYSDGTYNNFRMRQMKNLNCLIYIM